LTLADALAPFGWWPSIVTATAGVAVSIGFLLAPNPPRIDPRGQWVSVGDTLVINSDTAGTFHGDRFSASARGDRVLLRLPHHPDGAVLTVARDSLVMTTGIRTLLHEGDTVRVFSRAP
jgi:hypothetical protein